jgi:hypothetical protein
MAFITSFTVEVNSSDVMAITSTGKRMMKKIVRQGRSERKPEEVHTKLRLTRSLLAYASG